MKFIDYNLSPELMRGIDSLGFRRPTDIQYKCMQPILRGEDVMAVAQTGTGKTGAFAIPLIHHLHNKKMQERRKDGIKCIILAPTHELALQITKVFETIGKYTLVKTLAVIGGVDQDPQIKALQKRTDILVATPGRMFDLISQGYIDIHRVDTLILDEADQMLDLGFIKDIQDLTYKLPESRQTLFFSATISPRIKNLAYSVIRKNAIRIKISPKDPVAKNVTHYVSRIEMDDKRFFLERLVENNPDSKILVFVRTKVRAERVKKAMERVNISSLTIHGDKVQEDRNNVLLKFRNNEVLMLIGTDVTARGIDIPGIDFVVNYDIPDKAENYVHRIGRTGRGKLKGTAYSFCSEEELPLLKAIQKYTGYDIPEIEIKTKDVMDAQLMSNNTDLDVIMDSINFLEEKKKKRLKRKKK